MFYCSLLIYIIMFMFCCSLLINYADDRARKPSWMGYLPAIGIFVSGLIQSIFYHQNYKLGMSVGMRVRCSLVAAIYRKVLFMIWNRQILITHLYIVFNIIININKADLLVLALIYHELIKTSKWQYIFGLDLYYTWAVMLSVSPEEWLCSVFCHEPVVQCPS